MKTLIVYYSLEGNCAYAAARIAEKIGADTLSLKPRKAYRDKGLMKFIWGGKSALMAEKPALEDYQIDYPAYERIILASPVWAGTFAPPLRTFIEKERTELKQKELAAFVCEAGSGGEKALSRMAELIGKDLTETAIFIDPKDRPEQGEAIDSFSERLGS